LKPRRLIGSGGAPGADHDSATISWKPSSFTLKRSKQKRLLETKHSAVYMR
jgi:hypothetical protein